MIFRKIIGSFALLFCVSLSALIAQEKVIPKAGDGITILLKRYNRTGKEHYNQFVELNKGKLGKGNALRMGVKYTLPPLKKTEKQTAAAPTTRRNNYEPLFGKESAKYTPVSSELKNACFYLVSGHGGPDPGAIGKVGNIELHEDEYAYDIMLRLARNLMMRGAKVHIIIQDAKDGIRDDRYLKNSKRETCMGSTIPFNQFRRLEQRCVKINELNKKDKEAYRRAFFIHVDSRHKGKQTDVFFYYSKKNTKESKNLAQALRTTFDKKYDRHQPGRGFKGTVEQRSLYVLNNAAPVSAFVELGNIQNTDDQKRLVISDNRQAVANWLCEGFIADYKRYMKKK